jgi:hypothetical protein
MSFTDLAGLMEAPRASLYRSIQSETIKFSTLKKLAEVLDLHVVELILPIKVHALEFLDGEIVVLHHQMNYLAHQLVYLKHGKTTFEEIQAGFDSFARVTSFHWPNRITTIDMAEQTYLAKYGNEKTKQS